MSTKEQRTVVLLESYRGHPYEFEMLVGVLHTPDNQDRETRYAIHDLFDFLMIYKRIDEVNTKFMEDLKRQTG